MIKGLVAHVDTQFDDRLLGYGTNPYPLLLLVALLMIPSFLVFADEGNVVAVSAASSSTQSSGFKAAAHPSALGEAWNWDDALIMTVHYHVPIIGSAVGLRFEPTTAPLRLPRWFYVRGSPFPALSGHLLASLMSWTNWLLWSLLLLVVARAIRIRMVGGGI
jgi:hypothetical protein